jgi:protein-S-isoprenylcysteine O-methyltransferase Ste14
VVPGSVDVRGLRYAAQRLGLLFVFACLLFAAAGQLDWPRGWGYLLTVLLLEVVTLVLLAVRAPETLNRRGSAGSGVEPFDKAFAAIWLSLSIATPIVAGLDAVRFHWSSLPVWCFFAGLVILVPASLFGDWAMVENEHFEQFVRIQEERSHRVVTTGPYRVIRRPGYLGAILGAIATPLMLGSAWTFVPAGLVAGLFVARTGLEDLTLARDLDGYAEYSAHTRYRLVPWVW